MTDETRERMTLSVNGTMMWYYYICHRQVWLTAHHITPDSDDPNIQLVGTFLNKHTPENARDISRARETGHYP